MSHPSLDHATVVSQNIVYVNEASLMVSDCLHSNPELEPDVRLRLEGLRDQLQLHDKRLKHHDSPQHHSFKEKHKDKETHKHKEKDKLKVKKEKRKSKSDFSLTFSIVLSFFSFLFLLFVFFLKNFHF